MDERLAESLVSARHKVLGRGLRPFCLWHAYVLKLLGSPFAGCDGPFDFAALYLAVRICSLGYDPELKALDKGRFFKLRFFLQHRGWKKRFRLELAKFHAYLKDHRTGPDPRHFYDGDGPACGVDHELVVVARLMRHAGKSERDAWEYPEGKAVWMALALIEAGGQRSNLMDAATVKALKEAGYDL